jgi:hypothetical protein
MTESMLDTVKAKIQRFLGELVNTYEVGPDFYRVRYDSTALMIRPFVWQEKHVMVSFSCMVLREMPFHANLWKRIAEMNKDFLFGKAVYYAESKILVWEHYLLGDFMDKDEFMSACSLMVMTANDLDDKLQKEFGGKKFSDA